MKQSLTVWWCTGCYQMFAVPVEKENPNIIGHDCVNGGHLVAVSGPPSPHLEVER